MACSTPPVTLTGSSQIALARNPRTRPNTAVARRDSGPEYAPAVQRRRCRRSGRAGSRSCRRPARSHRWRSPAVSRRSRSPKCSILMQQADDGHIYPGGRATRTWRAIRRRAVPGALDDDARPIRKAAVLRQPRLCSLPRSAGSRAAAVSAARLAPRIRDSETRADLGSAGYCVTQLTRKKASSLPYGLSLQFSLRARSGWCRCQRSRPSDEAGRCRHDPRSRDALVVTFVAEHNRMNHGRHDAAVRRAGAKQRPPSRRTPLRVTCSGHCRQAGVVSSVPFRGAEAAGSSGKQTTHQTPNAIQIASFFIMFSG